MPSSNDKIDGALFAVGSIAPQIFARIWDGADRTFKLASWGLVLGALNAIRIKADIPNLKWFVIALVIIWVLAACSSLIALMIFMQEKIFTVRSPTTGFRKWFWIVISFSSTAILFVAMMAYVMPAMTDTFLSILDYIGAQK